jgi:hypothetical protein
MTPNSISLSLASGASWHLTLDLSGAIIPPLSALTYLSGRAVES